MRPSIPLAAGVVLTGLFTFAPEVMAGRSAPEEITPIIAFNKIFTVGYKISGSATQKRKAYVEASDLASGRTLWKAEIYTITYDAMLDSDVEDVYVSEMKLEGKTLLIEDETGQRFALDLNTRKVRKL